MDINEGQVKALTKVGLNLTHFWVLHILDCQRQHSMLTVFPDVREVRVLKDRFLVDLNGITDAGKRFYDSVTNSSSESGNKKKAATSDEDADRGFDDWWKVFPGSANFSYRGMNFTSGRVLKSNKQVCKMLYNKVIISGDATAEQMVKSLRLQLILMMKESYETGQNRMQYMSSAEVYLRQGKYEAFLEQATSTTEEQLVMEEDSDNDYDSNCA